MRRWSRDGLPPSTDRRPPSPIQGHWCVRAQPMCESPQSRTADVGPTLDRPDLLSRQAIGPNPLKIGDPHDIRNHRVRRGRPGPRHGVRPQGHRRGRGRPAVARSAGATGGSDRTDGHAQAAGGGARGRHRHPGHPLLAARGVGKGGRELGWQARDRRDQRLRHAARGIRWPHLLGRGGEGLCGRPLRQGLQSPARREAGGRSERRAADGG